MLKEERQGQILQMLHSEGKVLAPQLSLALKVSEDTIRRDLRDLAEARLIQRVHGGALLRAPSSNYLQRRQGATTAKAHIAQVALSLIRNDQVIILDGGTTTLQLACSLPTDLVATVITNSPPIGIALAQHPGVEVILLGGKFSKEAQVTVGVTVIEALRTFRADVCMLGVCSVHPELGVSVPNLEEAYVKRAMIASAAEVVALASAEKLNTAAPYVVGPLADLTYLVTEQSVSATTLKPYRAVGLSVLQAD